MHMHSSFERHILYAFAHCVFAAARTNDTVLVRSDANENFSLFLHCALWCAEPTLSIKYILLAIELQIRDSRTKYFCFFFFVIHTHRWRAMINRKRLRLCVCGKQLYDVVLYGRRRCRCDDRCIVTHVNQRWVIFISKWLIASPIFVVFCVLQMKKKKYTNIYRTSEQ